MAKEVTKRGQIVEIQDISQITVQGRIIEVTILEEMLEGTVDRIIEETTEIVEIGTGQEKDHSQEITVTAVTGAQAIVDQDQGPEQIQIGIG